MYVGNCLTRDVSSWYGHGEWQHVLLGMRQQKQLNVQGCLVCVSLEAKRKGKFLDVETRVFLHAFGDGLCGDISSLIVLITCSLKFFVGSK